MPEYLLDLGHQLGFGIVGRVVGVFLNYAPHIVIQKIKIGGIRRSEIRADEVREIIQPFLIIFGSMARS